MGIASSPAGRGMSNPNLVLSLFPGIGLLDMAFEQEGFCVVVATIDRRTGRLHKSPDIISRGFVYLRDNKELMDQTRLIIRKSVEQSLRNPRSADFDTARDDLAESVSRFLLQRTMKRPIVIPVIVSV